MKSQLNFTAQHEDGDPVDMHSLGLWVESFRIYSPNVERNTVGVPGKKGEHVSSTVQKPRKVSITFQFETDSYGEFEALKQTIYQTFLSEKAIKIVRDITPSRHMFVYQEGEYDIENVTPEDGEFSLDLTMFDTDVYGEKKTIRTSFPFNLNNAGYAKVFPKYTIDVEEDTTMISIYSTKKELTLGRPLSVDSEVPFQKYTTVLSDNLSTLTSWATGGPVDLGTVAGTFATSGYSFYPNDYGTGSQWHGPAIKKALPEPIQNFRVTAKVLFPNENPEEIGRLEVYLLDANGAKIAKISLRDGSYKSQYPYAYGEIGGRRILDSVGSRIGAFNNFNGIMRITKDGQYIEVYFAAHVDENGVHHGRRIERFKDTANRFTSLAMAQIQLHQGAFGTYQPSLGAQFMDILVEEIHQGEETEIPYIAKAGDQVVIDTDLKEIRINGEIANKTRDPRTEFFSLVPGETTLGIFPETIGPVTVEFIERFLV